MLARQMLPTSHPVPINSSLAGTVARTAVLADAFTEFSAAADRLERSYQELQKEVVQLRAILAERSQALRASRTENSHMKLALRQILDSLPCGVLVLDQIERVILCNPEARRLLGASSEPVESLAEIPRSGMAMLKTIQRNLSQADAEDECCLSGQAGPQWLAVRHRKLTRVPGGPAAGPDTAVAQPATILILRDTTSQKKLEEEREAARNVVALAEMSAVLAHEIRNPLASLELFAGLIGERNEAGQEYVEHLQAGIRSLSATVNNVLRFHSGGALQLLPMSLAESLHSAVAFVRPLTREKGIELSLRVEPEDLAICGDHNALQQVFLNLALNAFRFTATGGWLRITAKRCVHDAGRDRVRVDFTDDGCGIEPTLLSRVFDAGCSGNGQTPGLGLAVCRRILEQHGGSISVTSETGRGTTFSLEFPSES